MFRVKRFFVPDTRGDGGERGERVTGLGEIVMILDLHRQGSGVSAIARRTGLDRKTVHKVIAGGLEPPVYGPRPHRVTQLQPFEPYLRERLAAVPEADRAPPAP